MEELCAQDFISRSLIHTVLTEPETADLLTQSKSGNREATETIIVHNQKLVASIAKKYYNRDGGNQSIEFCDLMQVGNMGLEKAIEMWDAKKGVKFDTYAYYWIKAYVRRYSVHLSTGYSLSFGFADRLVKIRRARGDYLTINGKEPDAQDLQTILPDMSINDIKIGYSAIQKTLRLELERDPEDDDVRPVVVQSKEKTTEDHALEMALVSEIKKRIDKLPENWQTIIKHRYEIDGAEFMTTRELADFMGVTRQFVEYVEERAINKLKTMMMIDP